jgi:4-alpha-glucanotransferase
MNRRGSGILLHISSLPSAFGVGDFGPAANRFADFLSLAGQSFWQVLPLNPTDAALGSSPYSSPSAFALNPLFISPELLAREHLLENAELSSFPHFPEEKVDFAKVLPYKRRLLEQAFVAFRSAGAMAEYRLFCEHNGYWLNDFALFQSLKHKFHGQVWSDWPEDIRDRQPQALEEASRQLSDAIEYEKFLQFVSARQWSELQQYCSDRGIQLIGDIPIYVNYDSADVWSHPYIFKLNQEKKPTVVAGVPPDYFSETGQLWGNPVYDWDALRDRRYAWWVKRMERTLGLYDLARIDHFRGLVAFWEVPAREETAINGYWVKVPTDDFFSTLSSHFFNLPLIAEDLGYITAEVREVVRSLGLPGMKILQFAFGADMPDHPYLPHNYDRNCVVYTGTHDNNTVRGWFENEADDECKQRLAQYFGFKQTAEEIPWTMVRAAMMSVADLAIAPLQDIVGLGGEARMNKPSVANGNWSWRCTEEMLSDSVIDKLKQVTHIFGRASAV